MPDQVPEELKRERIERLVEVVQRVAASSATASASARVEEVLVEGPSRTDADAPPRPHTPQHDGQLLPARPQPESSFRCGSRSATSTTLESVAARRRCQRSPATSLWDGRFNVRELGGHADRGRRRDSLRLGRAGRQRQSAERGRAGARSSTALGSAR